MKPVAWALALLLVAGCSTRVEWPAPHHIVDLNLDDDHRQALAAIDLGDAVHVVLPPPRVAGTQWQILILNGRYLRQMTDLKPLANGPAGAEDVQFQGIYVTPRTIVRLAALSPNASGAEPTDVFTIGIGVRRRPPGS